MLEFVQAFENDVAPLDVPELLENLVRQSEPFLDQIGVKKGDYETVFQSPPTFSPVL